MPNAGCRMHPPVQACLRFREFSVPWMFSLRSKLEALSSKWLRHSIFTAVILVQPQVRLEKLFLMNAMLAGAPASIAMQGDAGRCRASRNQCPASRKCRSSNKVLEACTGAASGIRCWAFIAMLWGKGCCKSGLNKDPIESESVLED